MRTIVALEKRFSKTPDGKVWAIGWLDYSFWQRYLEVFEEVRVVARLGEVDQAPAGAQRADGPQVSFAPIPYYVGPWQFARRCRTLPRAIRQAVVPTDAVILRVPGTVSSILEPALRAGRRPYGVEVVGDPYDVFAPGGVRSVMRPLFRWLFRRGLRRQCSGACAVAYVTRSALQARYPAGAGAHVTSYSSLDLDGAAFAESSRPKQPVSKRFGALLVGSLAQLYKGPDVLISAVALLANRGWDPQLTIVGDGKHRGALEQAARARGLAERTRFTGNLPPGDPVRAELDRTDLFVMPSRTEGLPRVLIEAMARGLPCVGSNVGGIPELLSPEELVPPGDAEPLAAKMAEIISDADRMARLSERNLEKAREFHRDALRPRRRAFYEVVRAANSKWQRVGPGLPET